MWTVGIIIARLAVGDKTLERGIAEVKFYQNFASKKISQKHLKTAFTESLLRFLVRLLKTKPEDRIKTEAIPDHAYITGAIQGSSGSGDFKRANAMKIGSVSIEVNFIKKLMKANNGGKFKLGRLQDPKCEYAIKVFKRDKIVKKKFDGNTVLYT